MVLVYSSVNFNQSMFLHHPVHVVLRCAAPKSFEKSMPLNPADQEEAAGLSEDEIADVDLSDDDRQQGPNAAEVLRAQTIGGGSGGDRVMSSSSGSSGSGSSDSDSDDNSSSSAADEEIDIDGDI